MQLLKCMVTPVGLQQQLMKDDVSDSNGNIKCPMGKIIFAINLLLKLLHATVANLDTGILSRYVHNMIGIWIKCCQNLNPIVWSKMYKILSFFDKEPSFLI